MTDNEDSTISAKFRIEGLSAERFAASVARHQPKLATAPHHAVGVPNPPSIGVADEIAKLGQLRDQGLLTEDEFAAQKSKLLESP